MATTKLVSPVDIDYCMVRTVTSADRKIIELSVDLRWYGPTHPTASEWTSGIEALLLAITVTTGEDAASILDRLDKSIDRSFARRTRESNEHARRCGFTDKDFVQTGPDREQ